MSPTITYDQIVRHYVAFPPPKVHLPVDYEAPLSVAIQEYRSKVHPREILWVLCREEFMEVADLRGFSLWMARIVAPLVTDHLHLRAIAVASIYLKGYATEGELAEVREELINTYPCDISRSGSIEHIIWCVVNQVVSVVPFPHSAACAIGYYLRGNPMGDTVFGTAVVDKLLEYFVARETGVAFEWVG